jgi:L-ascorbate metabolism protein UlaG (beta-lactamase superfamily)
MNRRLIIFIIALVLNGCIYSQQHFELRYLGNMGVAIVHNDSAVIIDGLHDFYENDYLPTSPQALNAMLKKNPPFGAIAAIAVTHRHSDHFDSALVTAVAKMHPAAVLIGGAQTRQLLGADMQKRMQPLTDSLTITVRPNITIHIRRITHTWPQRHAAVENYRYELVWNGFRVVHLGDADTKPGAMTGLNGRPDIMIIPNWFLSGDGIPLLEQAKPAAVIVTHIAPHEGLMKKNNKLQAKQVFFNKYGDTYKTNYP